MNEAPRLLGSFFPQPFLTRSMPNDKNIRQHVQRTTSTHFGNTLPLLVHSTCKWIPVLGYADVSPMKPCPEHVSPFPNKKITSIEDST